MMTMPAFLRLESPLEQLLLLLLSLLLLASSSLSSRLISSVFLQFLPISLHPSPLVLPSCALSRPIALVCFQPYTIRGTFRSQSFEQSTYRCGLHTSFSLPKLGQCLSS